MAKTPNFRALPEDLLEFYREQGKRGGKLSAAARLKKVTPERRREIARKASAARWNKKKAGKRAGTKTKGRD